MRYFRKRHWPEYYREMFELVPVEEIPKNKLGKRRVDYDRGQLAENIVKDFMDSGHRRAKVVFRKSISEARNVKDFTNVLDYTCKDWKDIVHYPVKVYVRTDKIVDPFDSIPNDILVAVRLVRIFLERTD